MRIKAKIETEIEVSFIEIKVPVNYGEEDIPNDFPFRRGNIWEILVEVDTGKIVDWPQGESARVEMKVDDGGSYVLYSEMMGRVAAIVNDYVPHGIVPGEYGDYIDLDIDVDGVITNWPKNPDLSEFFKD